jgi:SAM-dependent methyltransferase
MRDELDQHYERVRRESRRRARLRGCDEVPEDVEWVVSSLPLDAADEVLDVAAGTGVMARALAPRVRRVVASDVSEEMLAAGAAAAPANVSFERALAEELPYPAASFDLVVNRFAVHHFLRPEMALHQMHRVCRPGGQLLLIDIVAPGDAACGRRYNSLQRSRDSSHARALSSAELEEAVEKAGWHVRETKSRELVQSVPDWLAYYPLDPVRSGWILRELQAEVDGGPATGLRPFLDGGKLKVALTMDVVRARK